MRLRGGIEEREPGSVSDKEFLDAVVDVTVLANEGTKVPPAVESLLLAIALTRTQKHRKELAAMAQARAEERAGALTAVALQLLRVAIFALGV
jgi:hypothetical protein